MKTKMKRQGSTELPRFIVGALATAGASAASGATVQITFANNVVSSVTGLINFEADLTGDGDADLIGNFASGYQGFASLKELNQSGLAFAGAFEFSVYVALAGMGNFNASTYQQAIGGVPFTFTDARINGGALTSGFLDLKVTAFWNTTYNNSNYEVKINRLIFDDAGGVAGPAYGSEEVYSYPEWVPVSAVPEASTSLGLLALGAGGILTRRRSKRVA